MTINEMANEIVSCPTWCVMHGAAEHSPFWHGGVSRRFDVPASAGAGSSESVDVRAALYQCDDSDDRQWEAAVELEHHVDGRYRLIRLTPLSARHLARLLVQVSDEVETASTLY